MHMRVVVRGVHLLPGVPACAGLCIAPSDVVFVLACGAPDCGWWQVSCGVLERTREVCSVDSAGRGTEGKTVHVCILADMMFSLVCWCHHASRKRRAQRHRAWAPGVAPHDKAVCYSYSVLCDNIITLSFPYYATFGPVLQYYNVLVYHPSVPY
jgi:hypothetical protein